MPEPYVFPLEMQRTVDLSKSPTPDRYLRARLAREWMRCRPRQKQRRAANIAQTRRATKAAEAERWQSKFRHAFCARGNLTVPSATLAKDPSPRAARRANERWAAKGKPSLPAAMTEGTS